MTFLLFTGTEYAILNGHAKMQKVKDAELRMLPSHVSLSKRIAMPSTVYSITEIVRKCKKKLNARRSRSDRPMVETSFVKMRSRAARRPLIMHAHSPCRAKLNTVPRGATRSQGDS